jgi:hypothetical protein
MMRERSASEDEPSWHEKTHKQKAGTVLMWLCVTAFISAVGWDMSRMAEIRAATANTQQPCPPAVTGLPAAE